eukprot:1257457-Pleurochrysis_carterae.AAC.1
MRASLTATSSRSWRNTFWGLDFSAPQTMHSASNHAQRLSVILLALLRSEFRHYRGKYTPAATLAWLHARTM